MWGALASTLQCVILAGNTTEVLRSFLIVMKHINSNEELTPVLFVTLSSYPWDI